MSAKIEDWNAFFSRCMREHVRFDSFPEELCKQKLRAPVVGQLIFEAWARQRHGSVRIRERLLCYFELLVQDGCLTDAEVLQCLRQCFVDTSRTNSSKYLSRSGQWKQTTEAAVLDRLSFQTMQRRTAIIKFSGRTAIIRAAKPLVGLLSDFVKAYEDISLLSGPELEIGNALGQYVGVYVNELSKFGLLTCRNGKAPKGKL